jgi:hypothetical protein
MDKCNCKGCERGSGCLRELAMMKRFDPPVCLVCGKPMVKAVDSITKKISKYLFKFDCNCHSNKDLRLSRG